MQMFDIPGLCGQEQWLGCTHTQNIHSLPSKAHRPRDAEAWKRGRASFTNMCRKQMSLQKRFLRIYRFYKGLTQIPQKQEMAKFPL